MVGVSGSIGAWVVYGIDSSNGGLAVVAVVVCTGPEAGPQARGERVSSALDDM